MDDLFPEFFHRAIRQKMPDQRYGQAVFNTAWEFYGETWSLSESRVDPFYDDSRVPAFLEALADKLTQPTD